MKRLCRLGFRPAFLRGRNMENSRQGRSKLIKAITAFVLTSSVLYAFGNSLINTLINRVIDAFGLNGTVQGLMSSLLSVGILFAQLTTPLLQGRIKKILMIALACLIQGAALLLSGFAAGPVVFGIGSVVLGLGCGWLDGYMNSIIIDMYPTDNSRPMLSLHAFFGIGSLLMPLIIQLLLKFMDWRGPYFVVAALLLALALIMFFMHRKVESTGGLSAAEEKRLKFSDIGEYLKKKRNILLLIVGFLCAMGQTGLLAWIVRYMTLEFDAEGLGATCITLYWILATLNRLLAPNIKVNPVKMIFVGAFLFAGVLGIGVLSHNMVMMAVSVALCGLFSGHFFPMLFMQAAVGYQGSTTMTTAIMQFVMGIGRILIPLLAAFVTDKVSPLAAMLLPACATVIAAVCAILIRKEDKTHPVSV